MIENGKKIMFNIAQDLHKGFATITESKKDEDDEHILYRLTDIECTSKGIEMHNNKDGELWVNDFEVIEVPEMCTSEGIKIHDKEITDKLLDSVSPIIWFYHNGENRCNDCGNYQFKGEHKSGCIYKELIRRIKEE